MKWREGEKEGRRGREEMTEGESEEGKEGERE